MNQPLVLWLKLISLMFCLVFGLVMLISAKNVWLGIAHVLVLPPIIYRTSNRLAAHDASRTDGDGEGNGG